MRNKVYFEWKLVCVCICAKRSIQGDEASGHPEAVSSSRMCLHVTRRQLLRSLLRSPVNSFNLLVLCVMLCCNYSCTRAICDREHTSSSLEFFVNTQHLPSHMQHFITSLYSPTLPSSTALVLRSIIRKLTDYRNLPIFLFKF